MPNSMIAITVIASAAKQSRGGQMSERDWNETDSRIYREIAAVAVPRREEQIAALVALAPFAAGDEFAIVELACGEGLLAATLLEAYPRAHYLGLDGSESMRRETAARLAAFGTRAGVAEFELASPDWLPQAQGAGLVVSSLCVHHLDGIGKRALFTSVFERLAPSGALLLADILEPARAEARAWFADSWDRSVGEQSIARGGSDELRRRFEAEHWNYYRYPDPIDRPSGLFEQLLWLRGAGLTDVDCFWMCAGHAVYGGYKPRA
jgi:tRNA (cmo5U34)-methyltransferase